MRKIQFGYLGSKDNGSDENLNLRNWIRNFQKKMLMV